MSGPRRGPSGGAASGDGAPGGGGPAVRLDRVSFTYPGAASRALEDVSLEVASGEVVAIGGESGSGKSTLARLVAGLLRPARGSVRTGGHDAGAARRTGAVPPVGLVFQNPNHQLVARTVADELALGPRTLGVDEREVADRVEHASARLGLAAVLGTHPYRLGMAVRARVALASVLVMEPAVLVLDEPTTGQGRREVDELVAILREERERGTTVLLITHDMRVAAAVADRLVLLHAGRTWSAGPIADQLADPARLAEAGLEPPQVTRLAIGLGLGAAGPVPLTVDELVARLGPCPSGRADRL